MGQCCVHMGKFGIAYASLFAFVCYFKGWGGVGWGGGPHVYVAQLLLDHAYLDLYI